MKYFIIIVALLVLGCGNTSSPKNDAGYQKKFDSHKCHIITSHITRNVRIDIVGRCFGVDLGLSVLFPKARTNAAEIDILTYSWQMFGTHVRLKKVFTNETSTKRGPYLLIVYRVTR